MTHVDVKDGNIESALKRFKVKVQRSGTLSEMKKRKEYSKPGIVRREAKKEAIKNARKRSKASRK
ncbi:MAG: 30S ribosomal protein S21 [Bacilli bacterium]|nr:30S ribosomal protein S21 [Bacilli bacterium]